MAEDRKKVLQALAAKRKAEAEGGRSAPKQKSSPLLAKPTSAQKSSPLPRKPNAKPSPIPQQQLKQRHHKKESPPKQKKKRVENYDTDDDDEEESVEESDSEKEHVKKKAPFIKGGSAAKASFSKPPLVKGDQGIKGKAVGKEAVKGKRKSAESSDDGLGSGDEYEEVAEADSGDEGLDRTNILPSRTRRHGSQPVHYDFTNMSGDDDDSD